MLLNLLIFLSGQVADYQASMKQPPVICDSGYKMTKTDDGWKCLEVRDDQKL